MKEPTSVNLISFQLCQVCDDFLDDPRILPCTHRFCLKCLESITVELSKCPVCQNEFEIPEDGLKHLKKQVEYSMDVCKRNADEYVVQTLNSLKDEDARNDYKICEDHLEIMNMFCEDCKEFFCCQCFTTKHKFHIIKSVSEFYKEVQEKLDCNLKMKKEILRDIKLNQKLYKDVICDGKIEASILKEQIVQRGKDLKTIIDSVVNKLNKNLEEMLDKYEKEMEELRTNMGNSEIILNSHIKTLKEQLHDLNYENVVETSMKIEDEIEKFPKYLKMFNATYIYDCIDQTSNIGKIVGTLRAEPKVQLIKEERLIGSLSSQGNSFAFNQNHLFICNWGDCRIDIFSKDDVTFKLSLNCKPLVKLRDLLVINNVLYVLGKSLLDSVVIVQVNRTQDDVFVEEFYRIPRKRTICGLSKSFSGNILLVLMDELIHLSENGDILQSIKLSINIYDALQLDDEHYVVTSVEEGVCIIGNDGEKFMKYSDENRRINSPSSLARDDYGYIYVIDYFSKKIFTLDLRLNFISCHDSDQYLFGIGYDASRDMLLAIGNCNRLLTFEL